MLFKVGNQIVDTETIPVALIFKDKEEAKTVGNILATIKDGDSEYSVEKNGNWWMMFPLGVERSIIDTWSLLTPEQKQMLDESGRVQKC